MKNKTIITILLYLSTIAYMSTHILAQRIVEPSAIYSVSSKYIDFEPGYWAPKGTVISANIKTSNLNCVDDYKLIDSNTLNEIDIEDSDRVSTEINSQFNRMSISSDSDLENTKRIMPSLSVYPNPFVNEIVIEVLTINNGPLTVDIVNLDGKLVRNITSLVNTADGLNRFKINVDELNSGLYFIQVYNNGVFESKKVIK